MPSARWHKHAKVYVKVGAFYALGKKTPPYLDLGPLIRRVVRAFGADRCMWESDCPFQVVRDRYVDSLALIRDRLDFLTREDRDWLLFRTAERRVVSPGEGVTASLDRNLSESIRFVGS